MVPRPGAVFIFDVVGENNALKEAKKLGLKTVGICDTNADPSLIDFPIPANDDAIKTIQLIADYAGQAVLSGKAKAKKIVDKNQKAEKVEEK